MKRREALLHTASILGGTVIGSQIFLAGCTQPKKEFTGFTQDDLVFLDEVAEVILPATSESGGAKAANVAQFMQTIITDCYDESEAQTFADGINKINQKAKQDFSTDFLSLTSDQRVNLIDSIDKEARNQENHYFKMMKELTLWAYFSSEVGCTEAMRFNPIPGRYEACIPYNNEPAWAG